MRQEIQGDTVVIKLEVQEKSAAEAAAAAARAEQALSNIYTGKATGTHITYEKNKVYHLPTAPGTGAITQDNEGAIFGISQKIYHQSDTIPPMPETWVRMGGNYDTGQLNTIYVEWISEDRQEYWIQKDNPTSAEDVATQKAIEAAQAANRAELAVANKLSTVENPALMKFNFIGGSESNQAVLSPSVGGWDQKLHEIGNTLVLENGTKIMVYSGHVTPYNLAYVGIAISENNGPFIKRGINDDGQLTFTPSEDPYLVLHNGKFYLYVEQKASSSSHLGIQLFTFESLEDLLYGNYLDHGLILTGSDPWELQDVSSPVIFIKDDVFHLIYEGRATGQAGAIGIATSIDGINFIKSLNNPIAAGTNIGNTVSWATHIVPDDIVFNNGAYYMTIHAYNGSTFAGGFLISRDLIIWKDYLGTWISKEDGSDSAGEGLMLHFDLEKKQYVVNYLSGSEIKYGFLTIRTPSKSGGISEKDGNVGIGTNNPKRKLEVYGPKNTSIIRMGSLDNDSSWVAGDKYGAVEFFSNDGSNGGTGVIGEIAMIDDGGSGNVPRMIFSVRPPGQALSRMFQINRNGDVFSGGDNTQRLGLASARWSEIYAASGSINTSDRNEKQDFEYISEAEKATAILIKSQIKKFRFKDSVREKGNNARIHFGVIAQEVEEAFALHGLNARDYGLFCEDLWFTKTIEVDGEPIEVEADKDDPESFEHVRLGIRYDELLAFIIAAI